MKMIKTFGELNRTDANTAGGKGASLGEMTNAGIPVPGGFVVLSGAFEYFIRETGIVSEIEATLKKVNHKEMESVERASEIIRDIIEGALMPKDLEKEILEAYKTLDAEWVAVRSSATAEDGAEHAWAGQLDSFLNTSENDLIRNVQRCFSSLFTPRAIFYRFEKGLHNTHISVAVVVQKMVQSEKSGIAFSVHPVTEDHNQMIIEGSWGLGEAIVSGQVTPDSYVVTKTPKEILDTSIAEKVRGLFKAGDGSNVWKDIDDKKANEQCLSGKEVIELADLIIKIENHYRFPCDIEWAYEKKKFYIVQSRPITTLQTPPNDLVPKELQIDYIKMGRWTMPPLDVETWHTEETSMYFKKYFGIYKEVLAVNIIGDETYNRMFIPKRFVEKLNNQIALWRREGLKVFEKKLLQFYKDKKKIKKEIPKIKAKDYSKITNKRLIELYVKNRVWAHKIVAFDQLGWIADVEQSKILHETMHKIGFEKDAEEYNRSLFALIKPKEISTTLEEKRAVIDCVIKIKQKKLTLVSASKKLTKEFGWMPVLAYGTPWGIEWYKKELVEVSKKTIEDLKKEFALLRNYSSIRNTDIRNVVKKCKINKQDLQIFIDYGLMLDTRNEAEYMNSLCGFYVLDMYKEISKRLKISVDELRLMFEHEVVSMLEEKMNPRDVIARKKGNCCVANIENVGRIELVSGSAIALDRYVEKHSVMDGENNDGTGRGVSASSGVAKGIVRIVKSPAESDKVKDGDILFTFSTTVDYLPAMKRAGAIVTEVGGLTCHAAVVSREFGIPCIVSLKNAMTDFEDGDLVEVDAEKGVVRIIKKA